jgi:hypothetical protein
MQKDIKKVLKKMSNERESETSKLADPGSNHDNAKAFAVAMLLLLVAAGLLIFIFAVLLPELGMTA